MSKRPEWEEQEEKNKILREQVRDCIEAEKGKMDRKAELLVLERRMQMERAEREMEEMMEKERSDVLSSIDKHEKEKRLAAEMSRLRREEERDEKTREQLRESSEELKLLENKLRAAHVNKQLSAQIAEKEAIAAQEKLEKQMIQAMIEAEVRCMEGKALEEEKSRIAAKLKYREELLDQINAGSKKVQDKERDLVLEKALLEQSMRKLREEDDRENKARMERRDEMKREIKEIQRQKELQKQNEKLAKKEEERRLKEYEEENIRKEEIRIRELKEKEAIKNEIRDKITRAHLEKIQNTNERDDILALLAEEEIRQQDIRKDKEKEEAAEKLKVEFQNAYKKYAEEKTASWKADFEDQERYREQLSESIALQEKLDKSSVGNRDLRSKELRESLQNQMKEKHKRKVEEWQQESTLDKLRVLEEKERQRIVEEERLKMLKKHAADLVGYFPRGVLRENDLTNLGPEFSDKMCRHICMNN